MAKDRDTFYDPESYHTQREYFPNESKRDYIENGRRNRGDLLRDINASLDGLDNYQRKLTRIQQDYNRTLNDQTDMMARLSNARSIEEEKAIKEQIKRANSYSSEYLKIMKNSYSRQYYELNREDRKQSKETIKNATKNAKQLTNLVKRFDRELGKSLSDNLSLTLDRRVEDFTKSMSDVYTRFNINRLVTNGVSSSSQGTNYRDTVGVQNSLTRAETRQISQTIRDYIGTETNNNLSSRSILTQAEKAAQFTGSRDPQQIAETAIILAQRSTLGWSTDIGEFVNTARSLDGNVNDYIEQLTNYQVSVSENTRLQFNKENLSTNLAQLQPGIAANANTTDDLLVRNKAISSLLIGLEDQSPDLSNAVSNILQTALNDPLSANSVGISSVQVREALSSGNIEKLMEILSNSANLISSSSDPLGLGSALNLDAGQVNAFRSLNENRQSINSSILEASSVGEVDPSEVISSGNYTRRGNTVFHKMLTGTLETVSEYADTISDVLGIDANDVGSQLNIIISLLTAIASSDLISTGSNLLSKFTGGGKMGAGMVSAGKSIFTNGKSLLTTGSLAGGTSLLSGASSMLAKAGPLAALGLGLEGILGTFKAEDVLGSEQGSTLSGKIASGLGHMLGGGINGGQGGILSSLSQGAAGAAIGTAILPGIGTAIGGVVGAVFGAFGGEDLTKVAHKYLFSPVTTFFGKVGEFFTGEDSDSKKAKDAAAKKKAENQTLAESRNVAGKSYVSNNANRIASAWFSTDDIARLTGTYTNSHKDGLDRVPEDEYFATLHKDEAVLTAEQASMWREQQRGASATNFMSQAMKNATFLENATTVEGAATPESTVDAGSNLTSSGTISTRWTAPQIVDHDLVKFPSDITAKAANAYITKQGHIPTQYFNGTELLKASSASGMDPRYLLIHAALESGWGTSTLAKAGNLFGIGAFDSNPMNGMNYTGGFAVGAKWIRDHYYNKGNSTMRKMWNNSNPGNYSTTPSQPYTMSSMMETFDSYATANQYAKGTPWVPEDQIALIHEGEMVVPKDKNPLNTSNTKLGGNSSVDLQKLLEWGFNAVVTAIKETGQYDPLNFPNFPETDLIRN